MEAVEEEATGLVVVERVDVVAKIAVAIMVTVVGVVLVVVVVVLVVVVVVVVLEAGVIEAVAQWS